MKTTALKPTASLLLTACALTVASALTSCSDKSPTAEINRSTGAAAPAPSETLGKVFATDPEAGPIAIAEARATAKPGDRVTLTGLVMGSRKPIVEGRAAFTLGDPAKLTPCNKLPDDHCATPWDVCCDGSENIKAATVAIQVVDTEGKVLKEPIENVGGLKPLSSVTVTGTVTPDSNAALLVLNASSIKVTDE